MEGRIYLATLFSEFVKLAIGGGDHFYADRGCLKLLSPPVPVIGPSAASGCEENLVWPRMS
jgi:hypothetical protein